MKVLQLALGALFGALLCAVVLDPRLSATREQRVVIDEFVARYCRPGEHLSREFLMGEAAALSRVAIRSGLNTTANIETAKCKIGLNQRCPATASGNCIGTATP
jgi:hypothetical protein